MHFPFLFSLTLLVSSTSSIYIEQDLQQGQILKPRDQAACTAYSQGSVPCGTYGCYHPERGDVCCINDTPAAVVCSEGRSCSADNKSCVGGSSAGNSATVSGSQTVGSQAPSIATSTVAANTKGTTTTGATATVSQTQTGNVAERNRSPVLAAFVIVALVGGIVGAIF